MGMSRTIWLGLLASLAVVTATAYAHDVQSAFQRVEGLTTGRRLLPAVSTAPEAGFLLDREGHGQAKESTVQQITALLNV